MTYLEACNFLKSYGWTDARIALYSTSTIILRAERLRKEKELNRLNQGMYSEGSTGLVGASGGLIDIEINGIEIGVLNSSVVGSGLIGSTGIIGASGSGFIGATGTGFIGATGIGSLGATYLIGATGLSIIGATGTGYIGATGSGIVGATGQFGSTGFTGATGIGSLGATGLIGATGLSIIGATGTGYIGATGSGIVGATGNIGQSGATGVGTQGATGVSGIPMATLTAPVLGDFTWLNQGTATVDGTGSQIFLYAPAVSGDQVRGLYKAAPATPYSVVAAFMRSMLNINYMYGGLMLYDSGSGKLMMTGFSNGGNGPIVCINKLNSVTSYNSSYTQLSVSYSGPLDWLKISDDGSNLNFYHSRDGLHWIKLYGPVSRTDFLTPSTIGISLSSTNSTNDAGLHLVSWTAG